MKLDLGYSPEAVTLSLHTQTPGLLGRLLSRSGRASLDDASARDRALAFAVADLQALGDERPGELVIDDTRIRMSHALTAALDSQTAQTLGLPPLVDLVFRTDVEGSLGSPSFRLRHEWVKHGRRQTPRRVGAILETSDGPRRLPLWLMEAVEAAEGFQPGGDDATHWEALARFRQALDPGTHMAADETAARVSMTDFLKGLEVRVADRFSLRPTGAVESPDFEVIPFSGRTLDALGLAEGEIDEASGELEGERLAAFQQRVRARGAMPAYRVGEGSYLVIDRAAKPVLDVMARMQRAAPAERAAFVDNPRPFITAAVEQALRDSGRLANLTPVGEEEAIEAIAGPAFVETKEYSARVIGIAAYRKPNVDDASGGGTTWLPETFTDAVVETLERMDEAQLAALAGKVRAAIDAGTATVDIGGHQLPATPETLAAVEVRHEARRAAREGTEPPTAGTGPDEPAPASPAGPLIIQTKDNFDEVRYQPEVRPRQARVPEDCRPGLRTALKPHQLECVTWQIAAWSAGLPGILNADDQGLGKTLETIAFLRWLQEHMATTHAEPCGPILVVAPTSLLENWEREVERHLENPGLGHLIRLYGAGIGARRHSGQRGIDTETGEAVLDFDQLHEAIAEGRGQRFWMLTTYATLTNYQHSLARLPFAALVFDEIQALKNPASLRAAAGRAINANFRIGLTGTPIENAAADLWAILDQLCPGRLGSLRDFRARYAVPDDVNMQALHDLVFGSNDGLPPLGMRRMKDVVATDLPAKSRRLHPRTMPARQMLVYEEARTKLAHGSPGSALRMLHHIRSVSVHPSLADSVSEEAFVADSARLLAVFDILRAIKKSKEKALVFIEHRKMQYRFIALAKAEFDLQRIDLINGDTPIQKRLAIVEHFQRHLETDEGFDLLVLGPKAAGTGLTLTAATHVIHLSRWWNPAVEEQCNDRVHRIGQSRPVTVHVPMAIHPGYLEHSFDCLLHSLMDRKRRLATSALWPMGDTADDAQELGRMTASGTAGPTDHPVEAAIRATFARDGRPEPAFEADGSVVLST